MNKNIEKLEVKNPLLSLALILLFFFASVPSSYGNDSFFEKIITTKESKIVFNQKLSDVDIVDQNIAQKITISGIITDEENITLPGVNIIVQGTSIGTVTDDSGKFTLDVPSKNSVLLITYIGYLEYSEKVGNKRTFSIQLEPDVKVLEDVVVVGYGVQKKESLVGAISKVEGGHVRQSVQGADLTTALRGAAPGLVNMISTGVPGGTDYSGQYGESSELLIRGRSTWNNASPLVLVDGVERDIVNVDPNEVEEISILKDASATAVFGVKGANGVILITTRRGEEGRARVSFSSKLTAKSISRLAEGSNPLNAADAVAFRNYAILNEVPVTPDSWNYIYPQQWVDYYRTQELPFYFPDVNWRALNLKDYTFDQNYNLSLTGGTKAVKYFATVSYLEDTDILNIPKYKGVAQDHNYKRLNFRSNLDFKITPTTDFKVSLSGLTFTQRQNQGGYSDWRGLYAYGREPFPIQYADGTYASNPDISLMSNSVAGFANSGYKLFKGTGLTTDFYLSQNLDFLLKGLSVAGKLAYDNSSRSSGANMGVGSQRTKYVNQLIVDDPRFSPDLNEADAAALEEEYALWATSGFSPDASGYDWTPSIPWYDGESPTLSQTTRSILYELRLMYNNRFDKHEVSGLALMSRAERTRGSVFPNFREDWVGRVTYGYDSRYLFEMNAAYNGSEKFAPKHRFGFFPSVAVGWNVHNEDFFKPISTIINKLRFRYSNGKVGSDAGIQRWLYTDSYIINPAGSIRGKTWYFGHPLTYPTPFPFRYEGTIANPDIHWETAHKIDYGIEAALFNNKFLINFDYFTEHRYDVFLTSSERIMPSYFGADPVAANIGEIDAKGWELELEFRKTTARGFNYWFKYGFAAASDKIIEKGDPVLAPYYQKQAGYAISQPRSILNQGKYSSIDTWNDIYNTALAVSNSSLRPGDFKRIDFNADGVIDADDSAPHGHPYYPQYTYSPSAGFSYKDFSANVSFYGVYNLSGGLAWLYTNQNMDNNLAWIPSFYVKDRVMWSPELGTVGKATEYHARVNSGASSGYVDYPRNYLRLESANITYNLTKSRYPWIKKLGASNIALSLGGNNLFIISDILVDMDKQSTISSVANRKNYPLLRRVHFGLNINF